jgi:hypothetical protein
VQKITKKTGIEAVVKWIAGEDCGCEERKEKLNKLFRYVEPLCLTQEEYDYLTKFRETNTSTLSKEELDAISTMWNRVFKTRKFYRPCTCNPKEWQKLINELMIVWKEY